MPLDLQVLESPAPLAPFVDCLFSVRLGAGGPWLRLPSSGGCLAFWRGAGCETFGLGAHLRAAPLPIEGPGLLHGVLLRAGGLSLVSELPAERIAERGIGPGDLRGDGGALHAAVLGPEASDVPCSDALGVLCRYLEECRASAPEQDAIVVAGVQMLRACGGDMSVSSLERKLGFSCRQLRRRFSEHVGLAPKQLARVYRVGRAVERIRRGAVGSFADAALELGYADQGHLIREFQELIGNTPGWFCRSPAFIPRLGILLPRHPAPERRRMWSIAAAPIPA